MPDQPYHVYVIQERGQRDYADCQCALALEGALGREDLLGELFRV